MPRGVAGVLAQPIAHTWPQPPADPRAPVTERPLPRVEVTREMGGTELGWTLPGRDGVQPGP